MVDTSPWSVEEVFCKGDDYFDAVCSAIDNATTSVDLEIYIFASDSLGERITIALIKAAQRSVSVRVIVDGIGSLGWVKTYGARLSHAGVKCKVYHQLFWEHYAQESTPPASAWTWFKALGQINKRTHRKLLIVDNTTVFIGSRNISACHSEKDRGERAWRDISAKVEGPAVADLMYAFSRSWAVSPPRRQWGKLIMERRTNFSSQVRLNQTRKLRQKNMRDLLRRMRHAKKRVWIVSSYFIPSNKMLKAIANAGRRGVDVQLLVPVQSDVFFMPLLTSVLYSPLLENNVKIFEFLPTILHAKTVIIDEWIMVGSSNFNHRSLIHDLEADVVLASKKSTVEVEKFFENNIAQSRQVTVESNKKFGLFKTALGHFALLFKYWC